MMNYRKNWSYYKPGDLLMRLRSGEEQIEHYENPYIAQALDMGPDILTAADILETRDEFSAAKEALILEVGCYKGTTLLEMATANPHCRFLGIDIKYKRVVLSRRKLNRHGIDSRVKVAIIDLIDCLEVLPPACLQGVCIFYPDPWAKERFVERRLFSPIVCTLLMKSLKPDGFLWIKTDHSEYLQQIENSLLDHPLMDCVPPPHPLKPLPYPTDFETLFHQQNKKTFTLCRRKWTA